MSAYSELIKSFEKIRAYIRDFYLYGFKSREEYRVKSARSYDDERRRIESWLGDHMRFVRTPEGKNVFISIDSRTVKHNPLYNAWKAKSFTDGDITLHFILFDILYTPSVKRTLSELLAEIDEKYLCSFASPMLFDESTVRKKLKEYAETGIISIEKEGRKVFYRRSEGPSIHHLLDALHFFSEAAPVGVIGSFLLDKAPSDVSAFAFKHHYITAAIDSAVLAAIFVAMQEKRAISLLNTSRGNESAKRLSLVPLRVFISAQSGRQHLLAYVPEADTLRAFRIDYLSNVKLADPVPDFDALRLRLDEAQGKMWGVSIRQGKKGKDKLEHVQFTVKVNKNEDYILRRLLREKRIGRIEKLDEETYRFSADVYDTSEIVPWLRSFICRIVQTNFSNRTLENQFKHDLEAMYSLYGVKEEDL